MFGYREFARRWYRAPRFNPPADISSMLVAYSSTVRKLINAYWRSHKHDLPLRDRSALDFARFVLRVLSENPRLLAEVMREMAGIYKQHWPDIQEEIPKGMTSFLDLTQVEEIYGDIPEIRNLLDEVYFLRRYCTELEKLARKVPLPPETRYIRLPTALSIARRQAAKEKASRQSAQAAQSVGAGQTTMTLKHVSVAPSTCSISVDGKYVHVIL